MRASYDATEARKSCMTDVQALEAAAYLLDDCVPILEWLSPGENVLDAASCPHQSRSLNAGSGFPLRPQCKRAADGVFYRQAVRAVPTGRRRAD